MPAPVSWSAENGLGRLVLRAPPLNLLTIAAMRAITQGLGALPPDEVRALLLEAEGPNFSAGADVKEHTPDRIGELLDELVRMGRALLEFPGPVVAAVRGACLGGGMELALCADVIVASDSARFAQPEIRLAAMAPVAAVLLPRRIGPGRAADVLFTGRTIEAPEAEAWGLVDRRVPDGELNERALEYARSLAKMSRPALVAAKRAISAARGLSIPSGLEEAVAIYKRDLARTHDAAEGIRAFLEKRAPVWKHA